MNVNEKAKYEVCARAAEKQLGYEEEYFEEYGDKWKTQTAYAYRTKEGILVGFTGKTAEKCREVKGNYLSSQKYKDAVKAFGGVK